MIAPVASLLWPAQLPVNHTEGQELHWKQKQLERSQGQPITSKLSSSFIPTCHFSNSLSQLRTVFRGQTTSAVVKSSCSQSSNVWRNVTTYRTKRVNFHQNTPTAQSFADRCTKFIPFCMKSSRSKILDVLKHLIRSAELDISWRCPEQTFLIIKNSLQRSISFRKQHFEKVGKHISLYMPSALLLCMQNVATK